MIGHPWQKIVGEPRSNFLQYPATGDPSPGHASNDLEKAEWLLHTSKGRPLNVLRTAGQANDGEVEYLVECFSDITALKQFMANQALDVVQARRILDLVEGERPRHLPLDGGLGLFVSAFNLSCMDEGGDHYFIRKLPPCPGHPSGRVLVSLKDQSGHQVGCMLRCILTDLLHQRLLDKFGNESLEKVIQKLNGLLCNHRLVAEDDFFTGVFCQIDAKTKQMDFLSCGHPRFFLIRDDSLRFLPVAPGQAGLQSAFGAFGQAQVQIGRPDPSGRGTA